VLVSAYTEDIMNRVSGHVGSAGRNQYDTSMVQDELALMSGANSARVRGMQTTHQFSKDRSRGEDCVVSLVREEDGQLLVVKRLVSRGDRGADSGDNVGLNEISTLQQPHQHAPSKDAKSSQARRRLDAANSRVGHGIIPPLSDDSALAPVRGSVLVGTLSLGEKVRPNAERKRGEDVRSDTQVGGEPTESPLRPQSKRVDNKASPSSRVGGSVAPAKTKGTRKMCEVCGLVSANYGMPNEGFRKRWCGTCGARLGAVNPGRERSKTVVHSGTLAHRPISEMFGKISGSAATQSQPAERFEDLV
jgi:hypothetical protein